MDLSTLLLLVLYYSVNAELVSSHRLQKRGLLELSGAIQCGTGRNAISYIGYGCYCGLGGSGMPKDAADWCCYKHDCCYDKAEAAGCKTKTDRYSWTCNNKSVTCGDTKDKCKKMMCKCDREIAKCLGGAGYNRRFIMYPNFLCGKFHPMCSKYED
ncbi:group 10 secretory phospholipase A2 [Discoglossus pictus]